MKRMLTLSLVFSTIFLLAFSSLIIGTNEPVSNQKKSGTKSTYDPPDRLVADDYATGLAVPQLGSPAFIQSPVANFAADPVIGEKDLIVNFSDLSEGIPDSWYWSFGDGYTSTESNPAHTYQNPGYYDVKLKVSNGYGSDSLIKENYIQVLTKPLADFTSQPTVGAPPLGVQFTDNSFGYVISWMWDFGDGDTSSLQNPFHEYTSLGTYDVTLIATSSNGSDTVTKEDFIFACPALTGDSVRILNVSVIPNQEDVVIPIIQSNESDSLSAIIIPLTFGDSSLVHVDSVSFVGSRVSHFEEKVVDISNEEATILINLATYDSPYLEIGEGLLAKIYLNVSDLVPPTAVFFDTTYIEPGNGQLFSTWDAESIEPGFRAGTLFVEKTDAIPPEPPQNFTAFPLDSAVSLTWTPGTEPDLRSYAIYRDTLSFTPASLDDTIATSLDPFHLDYDVSSGETYYYRVSALDSSWNESEYSNEASATFGDTSPPVIILGPVEIAITDTMVTIYWETDEPADGWADLWDTEGEVYVTAGGHSDYLLDHTVTLTGLSPSTSYQYRVSSTDSLGNGPTYSENKFFITASAPDATPPQIIFGPAVVFKTDNSATIEWTTDDIANGIAYYGQQGLLSDSVVDPAFVTSHSLTLTGLLPSTEYFYRVRSEDPSGNAPTYGGDFSYGTGDSPHSVFCADLDGDEDLDLAVANASSDNVSILNNKGDGTFQSKVDYVAGDSPHSVFCADLDGDEDLDLAVANWLGDNVSILKNNGDGTFQSKVDYRAGGGPNSVFCADLDGDEDLDLAVANAYSNNVSILKNNGDGTFQSRVDYPAGAYRHSVFCADLDGDTDLDLAVANVNSDNVSILKNKGDGTFQTKVDYSAGDGPHSVFCADLDGDTDLDLAVANAYSNNVSILKNNGDGTFQSKVDYGAGEDAYSVFCADFDGDEDLDLAVANASSDNVSILKNNGDATFQTKVDYGAGEGANSVFCADLDGDEDLDLAVANASSDNVSIFFNNGDGSFVGTLSFTTEAVPDNTAPVIVEGPMHIGITNNLAVINWSTDEVATSIVQYGLSELYGSEREETDFVQDHQIVLTNLEDSTLYHYRVGSVDPESNGPTWSSDFWFWTNSVPDTIHPLILTGPYDSWVSNTQAQIDWTTDELSDGWVYYGLGGSYNNVAGSPGYVTEHTAVLTNLLPNTTYNYYVSSSDPSGNTVESEHGGGGLQPLDTGDNEFTTMPSPDMSLPVIISGPYVTYKSYDQATVKWVTDETSNSIVEYGEDQDYGRVIVYPEATINHTAFLSNLQPNTTYHFKVGSMDIANNGPAYSPDVTFTTSTDVPDTMPPVITVPPKVPYLDESRALIEWETDEPSDSYMGYELISALGEKVVGESYSTVNHMVTLTLSSSFNVRVFSTDPHGNGPTYSDYFVVTAPTGSDAEPPAMISGPEVIYISENSAKIKWVTDEISSSFIEYGLSEEYTDIEGNPENEAVHEVTLTNLAASTAYHYRVKSADVFGNTFWSSDSIFVTKASSDIKAPLTPTGFSASYADQSTELSWNQNGEGDLSGYNLYRGTALSTLSLIASNLAHTTYQDQGLTNGVTYYYQLTAQDQSANESSPSEVVCSKPLSYLVGDFNGDWVLGMVDVIAVINFLFRGGEGREPLEAANVNCDPYINVVDIVYMALYLFNTGESPCNCAIPALLARHKEKAKATLGLCFSLNERSKDIEVTLEGEFGQEVAGLEFDLSFDPLQLEVEEISTTQRTDKLGLFYNVEGSKIKIGMVDIHGANTLTPGEGSLLSIKFRNKQMKAAISSAKVEKAIVVNTMAEELEVQIRPNKVIKSIPQTFSLAQNYPNPFNARTVIRYSLPKDSKVNISIYNVLGQKVKVMVDEYQLAGYKNVVWDGKNQKGKEVASGVYFYKIQADDFSSSKKMLLLK